MQYSLRTLGSANLIMLRGNTSGTPPTLVLTTWRLTNTQTYTTSVRAFQAMQLQLHTSQAVENVCMARLLYAELIR